MVGRKRPFTPGTRATSADKGISSKEMPTKRAKTEVKISQDDDGDFRSNILIMYLQNEVSGTKIAKLLRSAHKCGVDGVNDMADVGRLRPEHTRRDMDRKIAKLSNWPTEYYADVPVKDRKTGERIVVEFPFLLVHEVLLHIMLAIGNVFRDMCEPPAGSRLATIKTTWEKDHNIPGHDLLAMLGLHGDGVQFQTNASMNVISWNLCTVAGGERYVFTSVEKRDLCGCGCGGRCTLDAVLEVFKWCLLALYTGVFPNKRHDGTDWLPSDKGRKSKTGKMNIRAGLFQCRGDWPWFKWLFGFKGWQSTTNMCWRCLANKSSVPFWDAKPKAL